jgi:hypothetical protein
MVRAMIVTSASSLLLALRVASLAPALSLAAPADLAAQGAGAVYERRDECIAAALLTPEQCEFAYRNARAEFEQKAPRYVSRALCERSHKRCGAQIISTGGWDALRAGGASYVPRFAGVRVTGSGAGLRALPVIEGVARIAFTGRPVTQLQDKVTDRQGVVGLAATRGHQAQRAAPNPKRGDRDDTVRVPMEEKPIGADVAPGLYVDPDGVEWYKPARRH